MVALDRRNRPTMTPLRWYHSRTSNYNITDMVIPDPRKALADAGLFSPGNFTFVTINSSFQSLGNIRNLFMWICIRQEAMIFAWVNVCVLPGYVPRFVHFPGLCLKHALSKSTYKYIHPWKIWIFSWRRRNYGRDPSPVIQRLLTYKDIIIRTLYR